MLIIDEKVGADLKLTEDLDLMLSEDGQLEFTRGDETIRSALIRRIATDFSGYRRMVRLGEGAVILNSSYGSQLHTLLSSSNNNREQILETADAAAKLDGRVTVLDSDLVAFSSAFPTQVEVEISYVIKPEYQTIRTQTVEQASAVFII